MIKILYNYPILSKNLSVYRQYVAMIMLRERIGNKFHTWSTYLSYKYAKFFFCCFIWIWKYFYAIVTKEKKPFTFKEILMQLGINVYMVKINVDYCSNFSIKSCTLSYKK